MRPSTNRSVAYLLGALGVVLVLSNTLPGRSAAQIDKDATQSTSTAPIIAVGSLPEKSDAPVVIEFPLGEPVHITVSNSTDTLVDVAVTKTTELLSDGTYEPPIDKASWYAVGAYYADKKPGRPGVSIVGGHISYNGMPGTFYGLLRVVVGDMIVVDYNSGDVVKFIVTKIETPDKSVATDISNPVGKEIWAPPGNASVIRLFTCDPYTNFSAGHYAGNIVVFGERLN